jgi:PAS domain S-box-containing protein
MVFAAVTLAGTVISLALAVVAWRARPNPGATPLVVLTLAIGQWNLSHFLAAVSDSFAMSVFWAKFHYLGLTLVVPAVFVLLIEYAGREDLLTRRNVGLLLLEPLVFNVLVWTNGAHDLANKYARPGTPEAVASLASDLAVTGAVPVDYGPMFWINGAFHWGLAVVCLTVVGWLAVRRRDIYRAQVVLLGAGISVTLAASLVDNLGTPPTRLTEPAFVLTGVLLTVAVVRFDLVDLRPIARTTVLTELSGGVVVLDYEDRLVDVNPMGLRMLGLDPEEPPLGKEMADFLDHAPDVVERYRSMREGEETVTIDASGEKRHYQVHVSALADERDRYLGRVFLLNDVTDQQERKAELERQNEQLDRFASVVSHDLRNPIQVAAGRVDLARETDDDEEHLDTIETTLERMETIVDDVLTLAKQGQTIKQVEPVDVAEVAERAWESVETSDARLENEATGIIAADEGRLSQVFENLFRNATEHADSSVTVQVGCLSSPDGFLSNDGGGFYVVDDGPGIPQENRDAIFEPGHTGSDDGTGLGLAIVDSIVAAHGWDISVSESDTGGARFEITGVDLLEGTSG